MNLDTWPEVPLEQRPQRLYVNESPDQVTKISLEALGWQVVDVRVLPNRTDADRIEAWRCYLEGVRLGSIEVDSKLKPFIELEAKSHGKSVAVKAKDEDEDVDAILASFKSPRAWRGTQVDSSGKAAVKSASEVLSGKPTAQRAHLKAVPKMRKDESPDQISSREPDDGSGDPLL